MGDRKQHAEDDGAAANRGAGTVTNDGKQDVRMAVEAGAPLLCPFPH
jgi:hypothetical protein